MVLISLCNILFECSSLSPMIICKDNFQIMSSLIGLPICARMNVERSPFGQYSMTMKILDFSMKEAVNLTIYLQLIDFIS